MQNIREISLAKAVDVLAVSKGVNHLSPSAESFELALPDDLVTHEPEMMRQKFLVALALQRPLVVDGSGVLRVGTAALQLILALLRDAAELGIPVRLRSSGALHEALASTAVSDEPCVGSALAASAP